MRVGITTMSVNNGYQKMVIVIICLMVMNYILSLIILPTWYSSIGTKRVLITHMLT